MHSIAPWAVGILVVAVLIAGCTGPVPAGIPLSEDNPTIKVTHTIEKTENLPLSMTLDIPLVYSGYNGNPSLCYLGAYAMAAMYGYDGLDLSDVVAASGAGSGARYWGNDFITNGYGETSLIYASDNLGFSYILGIGKNGVDSDYNLPLKYRIKDRAKSVVYFNDADEALRFLKGAVAQGNPLVVHVDMFYLKDDLSGQNTFWNSIPRIHNSHFMTVTGYDDEYIYLNDPTAYDGKDLKVQTTAFMESWRSPQDFEHANLGPYWGIYLVRSGTAKEPAEIIIFNKQSSTAPEEVKRYAESGIISEMSCFQLNEIARSRSDFAAYLEKNDKKEASVVYRELSELYSSVCVAGDPKTILNQIALTEEGALSLL